MGNLKSHTESCQLKILLEADVIKVRGGNSTPMDNKLMVTLLKTDPAERKKKIITSVKD